MANYHGKYLRPSRRRPFRRLGIICCLLALTCALFVGKFLMDAMNAEKLRRQTIQAYVHPDASLPEETATDELPSLEATQEATAAMTEENTEEATAEVTEQTTVPTAPPRFPAIDFPGLREKNPDVVAWLQIPALEIVNYPVVRGPDNAYYTTHTWEGEESENGAIFLDSRNQADFSQPHSILYGHCMKDGSMFQSLGKWEGPEFFASSDRTVLLFLPDETRVYRIFAVERVNALDSRVFQTDYTADVLWEEALTETLRKSQHPAEEALFSHSEVLTLSTCVGEMNRLVVHAVCTEHVPN